ncbi:sugar transferase [Paracoccus sp. C2R09]|uniref:sugar transferase n=2 Tax=unclassified Paracoccus (in: a-proteobacteria) TaxID=2688777 RepID=UPI001C094BA1|nr:sugar transferase [Paracoccus sp. C2R09]
MAMEKYDELSLFPNSGSAAILTEAGGQSTQIYSRHAKRMVDLGISVAALPIFLTVLLVLATIIFLSDRRKPIFSHRRVGKNGKVFGCLKLRTMVVGAEDILPELLEACPERRREWDETQKLTDDPRITRLGHFLRKTSLDELPQILNVLRGDMSIVGPRPIVMDELPRYGEHADAYLQLRPGLTGMWQTTGRNDVSYEERVRMDVEYGRNLRFSTDMRIVGMTAMAMLRKTGR